MEADDVTHHRTNVNLRVRFHDFNLVFKAGWTVTIDLKLLVMSVSYSAVLAHINDFGEKLDTGSLRVYHWESMNGNKDLVAFTVNTN